MSSHGSTGLTPAERRRLALAPFKSIPVEHRLETRIYRGCSWSGSQALLPAWHGTGAGNLDYIEGDGVLAASGRNPADRE